MLDADGRRRRRWGRAKGTARSEPRDGRRPGAEEEVLETQGVTNEQEGDLPLCLQRWEVPRFVLRLEPAVPWAERECPGVSSLLFVPRVAQPASSSPPCGGK
jgi:hypothetical protein